MALSVNETKVKNHSTFQSKIWRTILPVCLLAIFGLFLSIPFIYVTQTLWYKVGFDKYLLWCGQLAGLVAMLLLFVQVILATRGRFLESIYGVASLVRWHRSNGVLLVGFAIIHVFCVLAPEGLLNLPIGKKYWPETTGALLLWILVATAVTSRFRERLKLDYKQWRKIHRPLGYISFFLVPIHVLFVSESFESFFPRFLLIFLFLGVLVWIVVSKKSLNRLKGN